MTSSCEQLVLDQRVLGSGPKVALVEVGRTYGDSSTK